MCVRPCGIEKSPSPNRSATVSGKTVLPEQPASTYPLESVLLTLKVINLPLRDDPHDDIR